MLMLLLIVIFKFYRIYCLFVTALKQYKEVRWYFSTVKSCMIICDKYLNYCHYKEKDSLQLLILGVIKAFARTLILMAVKRDIYWLLCYINEGR